MHAELFISIIYIPPTHYNLGPCPYIDQLLNEGLTIKRKLALVSTPAGFGEKTPVVDWLNQIDLPAA